MSRDLTSELRRIETRTRRWTGASVIIHVLVLLLIVSVQVEAPAQEGITEITWIELDPEPVSATTNPPVANQDEEEATALETRSERREPGPTEQFQRELARADVAPKPQSEPIVEDVLTRRIESLRRSAPEA